MPEANSDVTLMVAGQAGQGVDTAAELLARVMMRAGYCVFAYPDVMSRIRGGHNFTSVRVAARSVMGQSDRINVLLALDPVLVGEHREEMVPGGVVVAEEAERSMGDGVLAIPMSGIAREAGAPRSMVNTVGLGALLALVGQPLEPLLGLLQERFAAKGRDAVRLNHRCAQAGYRAAAAVRSCPCAVPVVKRPPERLLMSGSHAIGLGALSAGVQFFSGYPMSPATLVMEYLAGKQEQFGIVVEQAEDELAAINQVLGASYAGARAMTATSGGGFSLMVEGLGLAGMAELSCLIVLAQRPGPATGFPTRTEQGELLLAISASGDDFPRFVFAPGSAEQAFYLTRRAFALAEKYQVPAILLSDQYLSDSLWTLPRFSLTDLGRGGVPSSPQRHQGTKGFRSGSRQSGPTRPAQHLAPFAYRRYADTPDGVSPWLSPGVPNQVVRAIGNEHDEDGFQIESAEARITMHEKRMRKLGPMAQEVDVAASYPGDDAEYALVCWGSTLGPVREAVDLLRAERMRVSMVHLTELCPFPRDSAVARLSNCRRVFTVENNSTGQLARLLCRETRIAPHGEILKFDGRPFTAGEITRQFIEMARG